EPHADRRKGKKCEGTEKRRAAAGTEVAGRREDRGSRPEREPDRRPGGAKPSNSEEDTRHQGDVRRDRQTEMMPIGCGPGTEVPAPRPKGRARDVIRDGVEAHRAQRPIPYDLKDDQVGRRDRRQSQERVHEAKANAAERGPRRLPGRAKSAGGKTE